MQTVELVLYLREHGTAGADELSRVFQVSVRTVRAHIHNANGALSDIAAIVYSRARRGYRLDVIDRQALDVWLARMRLLASASGHIAQDERVAYLLNNLLERTDWITIADLSEMLFVSPQSISNDLKVVENALGNFGLSLTKRPRYGVRVEGPEMARRLCLAHLVSRTMAETDGGLVNDKSDFSDAIDAVSTAIDRIMRETDFTISSLAFHNLVIHVVVAMSRIREQAIVPLDEECLDALRAMPEYAIARQISQAIGTWAKLKIPETEVAYIAIHLAGKKTLAAITSTQQHLDRTTGSDAPNTTAPAENHFSSADEDNAAVIPEEIWTIVNEMLERVWEGFRFDFRDDIELHMNLARHLVPLTARLEFHLRMENPLLSDIKTRFPLAYAMGVGAASVLAERYPGPVSEEEVGYLALSFALAIDRLKTSAPKKNVLVVCASGVGTTRLLKCSILKQFGDRIGTVQVCDALHVTEQDFSSIDYVFTTVPITAPAPVPVQEINLFLNESDVKSINDLINQPSRAEELLHRLISPELFFARLSGLDQEGVLRTLAARIIAATGVDDRLVELVLEREQTASTAFGNRIALPHPIRPLNATTRICVGLLNEPIAWGGKQVQLVMLVAIGSEDPEALDFFFSGATELLSDEAAVARILENRTFATFFATFSACASRGSR